MKQGKPVMTDGPFAETKEALGGYSIVEAKDLDEVLSIGWGRRSSRVRVASGRPVG
jgi:hypothetical protein